MKKKILLGLITLTAFIQACRKDPYLPGKGGETNFDNDGPTVTIVSPVKDAMVARGEGLPGKGSFNGTGLTINIQAVTHDTTNVVVNESLNIRNTALLGMPNPNFPGLNVQLDCDLIKPDGNLIPKGTNLANLFNIAGTDDTPGDGVTIWTSWHILESLPVGINTFNLFVSVTDKAGRTGQDKKTYTITEKVSSGESLTPIDSKSIQGDGVDDADGPIVTMIAPQIPSSVSTGPSTSPKPPVSGALFFIQVSALDKYNNGFSVNVNASGKPDSLRGTIVDPTQSSIGPNRFVPGLNVTFDVDLLQPNGNIIKAGENLAPVFNTAGNVIDGGYTRSTFGWVVGGSLIMPANKTTVTVKAQFTDNKGKSGSETHVLNISKTVNGQELTPNS